MIVIQHIIAPYIRIQVYMYFVSVISCNCQLTNLALHKDAYQSSVFKVANASLAVDGSRQTNIYQDGCTHTNVSPEDNKPWWYVDLGSKYNICSVAITNRDEFGSYIQVVFLTKLKRLRYNYTCRACGISTSNNMIIIEPKLWCFTDF
jgi:hypothetical protein